MLSISLLVVLAGIGQGGVQPTVGGGASSTTPWALRRPEPAKIGDVVQAKGARGRIDSLVLARLETAGLEPSPPASPHDLLRRLTLDLTGLPPSLEALRWFEADPSLDAYEREVDRLLASPRFGERWGRLWLDVARYAEDQAHIVGDDRSLCYPNAYLYRDWVIGAFNEDLPFARFVELQLAADLIEGDDSPNLAALGFLGLGPKYYDRGRTAVLAEEWEDRVDVVGRGLLGLTVACARCHDHKFDPISTQDYHALAGVFASTEMFNRPIDDRRDKGEKDTAKKPEDALHIVRDGEPRDLPLFIRGNVEAPGETVPRRFLRALCDGAPPRFVQGSGRRELAAAVASPTNPLTARVFINRVWAECFGQPLVGTPSNFGSLGEAPIHPELLDDLAVRFLEGGGSLKRLLREVVLSATYRQSSFASKAAFELDPENRMLGRARRRRLSLEAWRDSILFATGDLDLALGGPSIDPARPDERRRTVYAAVSRLELNRYLALFDFPDPNVHAERRLTTVTPLQELFVLNGSLLANAAARFSQRVLREAADEPEQWGGGDTISRGIRCAYAILHGRSPTSQEAAIGRGLLEALAEGGAKVREADWTVYAHALLASSELLYLD